MTQLYPHEFDLIRAHLASLPAGTQRLRLLSWIDEQRDLARCPRFVFAPAPGGFMVGPLGGARPLGYSRGLHLLWLAFLYAGETGTTITPAGKPNALRQLVSRATNKIRAIPGCDDLVPFCEAVGISNDGRLGYRLDRRRYGPPAIHLNPWLSP